MDDLNPKPVCEIDKWGTRRWRLNGLLHRTDGPAVVWLDGAEQWYLNGHRHRTTGPAETYKNGNQHWFINDKDITKAVEKWIKDRDISSPFSDEETRVEFLLTWTI